MDASPILSSLLERTARAHSLATDGAHTAGDDGGFRGSMSLGMISAATLTLLSRSESDGARAKSFSGATPLQPLDTAAMTRLADASAGLPPLPDDPSSSTLIGRGAFGSVRMHFGADGEPIAAQKVMAVLDMEKAAAARREMLVASRQLELGRILDGVVTYKGSMHDAAEHRVRLFMEYVDGGHAGRLAGALSEPALAELAKQLIIGLHNLHTELRVLHRDLKPENVLVSTAGTVKIADFGVAALLEEGQSSAEDQVGSILQMAPERLRGEAHGPASDVWSLGVTVAQLALGRHPFVCAKLARAGADKFWMLAEVIKHTESVEECEAATWAAVEEALGSTSDALRDFVHRCTASDPSERATLPQLLRHPFLESACLVSLAAVAGESSPSLSAQVTRQRSPNTTSTPRRDGLAATPQPLNVSSATFGSADSSPCLPEGSRRGSAAFLASQSG